MKPLNPIVIYHANCTDGFAAAWCFHRDNPDGYDFYPATYGSAPPDVTLVVKVFLVDFSYKRDVLLQMAAVATSITILDHHKSAQKKPRRSGRRPGVASDVQRARRVRHEPQRCGHRLGLPVPNRPRPDVLACIEDRDIWLFKRLESREVQYSR